MSPGSLQAPRSAGLPFRSGTTGLFLLHTFARFKEPAEPGRCLGYPPVRGYPLFCATFCNNSTSGTPDLPGCLPDLGAHLLLGPLKSLNRQQALFFVRTFAHFAQSGSGRTLFLVRIFSNYPQSGKSVFFVLLFSAFLHPGSSPFFVRLFATFPDNRTAPAFPCLLGNVSDLPRLRPGCICGNLRVF